MPSVHIKKNDLVYVLSGKDRGKTGKVLKVFVEKNRAVVEGLNYIQKHTRPNPQKNVKGGILPKESPIHISNLMVVCKRCNKHCAGRNQRNSGWPQSQGMQELQRAFGRIGTGRVLKGQIMSRLRELYKTETVPALIKQFGTRTSWRCPSW